MFTFTIVCIVFSLVHDIFFTSALYCNCADDWEEKAGLSLLCQYVLHSTCEVLYYDLNTKFHASNLKILDSIKLKFLIFELNQHIHTANIINTAVFILAYILHSFLKIQRNTPPPESIDIFLYKVRAFSSRNELLKN